MPKARPGIALKAGLVLVAAPALGVVMFQATNATGDTRGGSLLPDVPVPNGNPITEEKRVLGKILFYEEQLSTDNTVSCATCHTQTNGGAESRLARNPGPDGLLNTDDDIFGSFGVIKSDADRDYAEHPVFGLDRQITQRAAPPVINAAHATEIFWDGRAADVLIDPQTGEVALAGFAALEAQAINPPMDGREMAHAARDWDQVSAKLAHARPLALTTDVPPDMSAAVLDARTYPELFRRAFGTPDITAVRIAMAIATYERTLVADDSPWDNWVNGDQNALSAAELRGFNIFVAQRCNVCHIEPLFTNNGFRNIGVRPVAEDLGRQNVTGDPADRGKFKVPGLRNLGLRTSFMHNGEFHTVAEVIDFYASNDKFTENIDGFVNGINLSTQQRADLTAFFTNGLTDPRVAQGVFPFDSPDLFFHSNMTPNPLVLPEPGRPGSAGNNPRIIAVTPPLIGTDDFKIGLADVPAGATATLVISAQPPIEGELLDWPGNITLTAEANADGIATAHWRIPFSPALDGQTYYFQWRVDDAVLPEPALSKVARADLFCGFGECATGCLADLNRDQELTFFDVSAFLFSFNNQHPAADLAAPIGSFDFFDLSAFLSAYNAGCP